MIRYDDYISPEEYLELRKLVGWRLFRSRKQENAWRTLTWFFVSGKMTER